MNGIGEDVRVPDFKMNFVEELAVTIWARKQIRNMILYLILILFIIIINNQLTGIFIFENYILSLNFQPSLSYFPPKCFLNVNS